jgi:type I restriction enzyme S subunit
MSGNFFDTKLPDGWTWETISSRYHITKKPKNRTLADYATIPFVPMESVPLNGREDVRFELRHPEAIASGTYFEKGDVLLSKITPSFENGKQGLADNIPAPFGVASTEIIPLQAITPEANHRFLFFYLLHPEVRATLTGKMEGSTGRQRVPEHVVRDFPIPMPPSPEQGKIGAVLWKIQRAIRVEEKLTEVAHELKLSAMRQVFAHGLRGEPQKETEIGFIPNSWQVQKVEDGVEPFRFARGIQIPASKYTSVGRFPIVDQGKALIAGYTNDETKIIRPCQPIIIFGDHTRILKMVDYEFALGADGTKPLTAKPGNNPQFLYHVLTSLNIPNRGYNRHYRLFADMQIPFPPDENEQKEIADILQTIDRKISVHERKRAALSDLFQTLLHQLMTAQIRVDKLDIDTREVAALNPQPA